MITINIPEPVLWVVGTIIVVVVLPLLYKWIRILIFLYLFSKGAGGRW